MIPGAAVAGAVAGGGRTLRTRILGLMAPAMLAAACATVQVRAPDKPIEINRADRRDLLRVPGIGPKGVESILTARRKGTLRDLKDLKAIGVLANRAAPFVLLNGQRPAWQLGLW